MSPEIQSKYSTHSQSSDGGNEVTDKATASADNEDKPSAEANDEDSSRLDETKQPEDKPSS